KTMDVTTADVAASPTAAALRPDCIPRRQPTSATRMPKTTLLLTPMKKLDRPTALRVCSKYSVGPQSEHSDPHQGASEDPDKVRVDREQRHHEDQRHHPRKDEELHRRDSHGGERVDLLIGGHRPQLRGEGGAGPARHDDRRHDAADLTEIGRAHV